MKVTTQDHHAHDFHVYIDGGLVHRVPCGVCERPGDGSLTETGRRYGQELHADIRETVRQHIEAYVRAAHPDSAIAVR